jgi:hypothetical protein
MQEIRVGESILWRIFRLAVRLARQGVFHERFGLLGRRAGSDAIDAMCVVRGRARRGAVYVDDDHVQKAHETWARRGVRTAGSWHTHVIDVAPITLAQCIRNSAPSRDDKATALHHARITQADTWIEIIAAYTAYPYSVDSPFIRPNAIGIHLRRLAPGAHAHVIMEHSVIRWLCIYRSYMGRPGFPGVAISCKEERDGDRASGHHTARPVQTLRYPSVCVYALG